MTLHTISTTALSNTVLADHWDGPGAWWPVFPLLWLAIVGTLVTLFVLGRRRRDHFSGQRAGERRLAERYAAGEIDDQEYSRRLGVLRGASGA
jgi:putative membrane protein